MQYDTLSITDAKGLIFGRSPNPVTTSTGVEIGTGSPALTAPGKGYILENKRTWFRRLSGRRRRGNRVRIPDGPATVTGFARSVCHWQMSPRHCWEGERG